MPACRMRLAAMVLSVLASCAGSETRSAGPDDGGLPDGAVADAGHPDAGAADGGVPDAGGVDAGAPDGGATDGGLVQARPYEIDLPIRYDPARPTPVIVLLHGYGASGATQDAYFGFAALADARTVLVARPDGTRDRLGNRFWNATDACCDLFHSGVDDVAYLNAMLDDLAGRFNVDAGRIFVVGHSDGGFMAHRFACDAAGRIAGIVALAGDVWNDPTRCEPARPVAVLQVHGDHDAIVPYPGGTLPFGVGVVPSAADSVATWAAKNGCAGGLQDTGERRDVDGELAGPETQVRRWTCPEGAAELWTIVGGGHIPALVQPDWGEQVLDWLMSHASR